MIQMPDKDGLHDKVHVNEQQGPGPRLRAAREALGYEVEDIAKQLRLHPHIIADLEVDTFSDHLALVFVRGYLRSYASLIGLDPNQVTEEFNAMGFDEERTLPEFNSKPQTKTRMRREEDMQPSNMSPRIKWIAVTAIAVALAGVFVAYTYHPQEKLYPTIVAPQTSTDTFTPPPEILTGETSTNAETPVVEILPATTPTQTQTRTQTRTSVPTGVTITPTYETNQQSQTSTQVQGSSELQLPKPGTLTD